MSNKFHSTNVSYPLSDEEYWTLVFEVRPLRMLTRKRTKAESHRMGVLTRIQRRNTQESGLTGAVIARIS